MEMLSWNALATVAGAAAVTRAAVQWAKRAFGVRGRGTHWLTLAVAVLVCLATAYGTRGGWLVACVHAPLVAVTASGIHEGLRPKEEL